jgi:hypothetical protein
MKKLSLFASVSAALVCAAVPASFNWSPANLTLLSLHTAEARALRTCRAGLRARTCGRRISPLWRAGLWLRPRALPGLRDRQSCDGKMVQNGI